MESNSLEPAEGQVCDRCRQKKIKCDGSAPACSNCVSSGNICEVSAKLRRRTKIRGYNSSSSYVERLETENAQLKLQLQAQVEKMDTLKNELDRAQQGLAASNRPPKLRKMANSNNLAPSPATISGESELSSHHRSAFVVKHMGRMVFDQTEIGRFAGSTTGVHFVASVEDLCRRHLSSIRTFPEDCFRLHLTHRFDISGNAASFSFSVESIRVLLPGSIGYYAKQLDIFNGRWLALCPVVPRNKFVREISQAFDFLRLNGSVDNSTACSFHSLVSILLVNGFTASTADAEHDAQTRRLFALSCQLHHLIIARSGLESLQSLILFSFFLQISGQTNWLTQTNGLHVRLAQSMGMHRHARRFKFTQSETELRKRMWWWVYCFDKLTSIVHGMPKLINDVDVDNDLPIDCELTDTDTQGLSHPLPGEPSPVAFFIQYVQICKILSAILGQLYTTSQRRGGEEKIVSLDRDLHNWHQSFCGASQVSSYDIYDIEKTINRARWQNRADDECAMIAMLDLLANYAIILIHRPALTFDNTTVRFNDSLQICMRSCTAIIQLADSSPMHESASREVPFGPALIFQSALMQVFRHLNSESADTSDDQVYDPDLLHKAMRILQTTVSSPAGTSKVVSLLESLSTSVVASMDLNVASSSIPPPVNSTDRSIVVSYSEDFAETEMWTASSLESLNHLDTFYGNWEAGEFLPA